MPGVIPDEGELLMLAIVLGAAAPEALRLALYVNDHTPGLTDEATDYTEMASHGYVAQALPIGGWTLAAAQPGTNTPARAVTAAQVFVFTAGPPLDVFGYALVGEASGLLWGAERFADGPYRVQNAGDQIDVTPTLRLRSEHPA